MAVQTEGQTRFIDKALESLWQRHRAAKVCYQMTLTLERRYGWTQVSGGELLLDCTYDQFDHEADPVRVARVGNADHQS